MNRPVAKAPVLASVCVALLGACAPEPGVTPPADTVQVTLADYQRAERFLDANTAPLVIDNVLAQYWQADDRLVYRKSTSGGSEYLLVDPMAGARTALFDPVLLAGALTPFTDQQPNADDLELSAIELSASSEVMHFDFEDNRYRLEFANMNLQRLQNAPAPHEFLSPDGLKAAFVDDHDLWLRNTVTNQLTRLSFDGEEHYGYATNNAGWIRDDKPVLLWSPASDKIATFRHDGRNVGEMYLWSTNVGHPELDAWKYPLPGDEQVFTIERVVIHLEPEPRIVTLDMPADVHRSSVTDHVADDGGEFLDVQWSADGRQLAFVSSSRDHRTAWLRIADVETGAVREVHSETAATWYQSGFDAANWRVLPGRGEFLWFSERDNRGHLYLHDLASGELKRQLTSGDWSVLAVQWVDADNEHIYFLGANREAGDPYYQYLYRVGFDGSGLVNLTPEPANHVINWSNSAAFFTDEYSTPVQAPKSVIRNQNGEVVFELEETSIGPLLDAGWTPPVPFTVKARDQQTDLYGLLYRPSGFDPARSYPVLNYLYPGPQTGSVGSRSFQASRRDKQALAELGFIVVEVDAMGTPGRSKSFHDTWYGDMGDNGLPDQITAIRQLAARHPWMDTERVGIWGHSGGGFAATAGILRYPDFYRVAVASAGNHDNRNYADDWGEKWQGLLRTLPETNPASSEPGSTAVRTNYDDAANPPLAANLQGKLLLAHGMMDSNVHPSNTLLVVQALIEAEKHFDLLLLPNAGHGFSNSRYFMQRRWDYFVEHLLGATPPRAFRFAANIE